MAHFSASPALLPDMSAYAPHPSTPVLAAVTPGSSGRPRAREEAVTAPELKGRAVTRLFKEDFPLPKRRLSLDSAVLGAAGAAIHALNIEKDPNPVVQLSALANAADSTPSKSVFMSLFSPPKKELAAAASSGFSPGSPGVRRGLGFGLSFAAPSSDHSEPRSLLDSSLARVGMGSSYSGSSADSLLSPASGGETLGSPALSAASSASAAALLYGSPGLSSPMQKFNFGTPLSLRAADTFFIQKLNATRDTLKRQEALQISFQGKEVIFKSSQAPKAGQLSNVYLSDDPACPFVVRLFQKALTRQEEVNRPPHLPKPPQQTPSFQIGYLINQFTNYAKAMQDSFVEAHHVRFYTFDALLQKAETDPKLLQKIHSLISGHFNRDEKIQFTQDYFLEGYILAEKVIPSPGTPKTDLLCQMAQRYMALGIPFDGHAGNWSVDGKMLDVTEFDEDKNSAAFTNTSMRETLGTSWKTEFDQVQPPETNITAWGRLVQSLEEPQAAAGGAAPMSAKSLAESSLGA